mgnify:CR=1 FL=1
MAELKAGKTYILYWVRGKVIEQNKFSTTHSSLVRQESGVINTTSSSTIHNDIFRSKQFQENFKLEEYIKD